MALLVANLNVVGSRHMTKKNQTMDVLHYIGAPKKQVQASEMHGARPTHEPLHSP
jgi:hypothetical protein